MKYTKNNPPMQVMMTQNNLARGAKKNSKPVGILWHDTYGGNPNLKRYVQPDTTDPNREYLLNLIGTNYNGNDWNAGTSGQIDHGLNAWIGKLADGTITTIQTAPWTTTPWGCGGGKYGSCNGYIISKGSILWNGKHWIQFEICDDNYRLGLNKKEYFEAVYKEACELTAYLCQLYNIDPNGAVSYNGILIPTIICHNDSYKYGFGNAHTDINDWFSKYGKTMDDVRKDVAKLLNEQITPVVPTPTPVPTPKFNLLDEVKLATGAKWLNGKSIPAWVRKSKLYVRGINGNNITISVLKEGAVTGTIDQKYLILDKKSNVAPPAPQPVQQPKPNEFNKKVGDTVKLKAGAKWSNGKAIPSWVFKSTLYIRKINTNGTVAISVLKNGGITGTININQLQ